MVEECGGDSGDGWGSVGCGEGEATSPLLAVRDTSDSVIGPNKTVPRRPLPQHLVNFYLASLYQWWSGTLHNPSF